MSWYVARSRPGKEPGASKSLSDAGLDPFYPKQRVISTLRGKTQTRTPALYPGYIFVSGELNAEAWHTACDGTDISGFLGASGDQHWTIIPAAIVDDVRAELDGDIWIPKDDPTPALFERGQALQVIDGPFTGMTVLCEWCHPSGRIRIKGRLLGRDVSLYVESTSLSATIEKKPETHRKGARRGKYGFPPGSKRTYFNPGPE